MSGWLDLGHPHQTDGDFFRAHNMSQEEAAGLPDDELHPKIKAQSSSMMPAFLNQRNAKLAGMGLVAGAAVGMVVVPFLAKRKIISKSKTWQVASVGAAIATPLVASYA
tara:strand:- start:874 stop:1200 length:327 start_codon:yes stop_codon:yes gene_type:complete